ncbi:MAG TPA: hypothetical protein VKT27_13930 [Candidatus Binataceae bacterium]|nr:hypothetical protein [Candidatus Binataceae bacterium]
MTAPTPGTEDYKTIDNGFTGSILKVILYLKTAEPDLQRQQKTRPRGSPSLMKMLKSSRPAHHKTSMRSQGAAAYVVMAFATTIAQGWGAIHAAVREICIGTP